MSRNDSFVSRALLACGHSIMEAALDVGDEEITQTCGLCGFVVVRPRCWAITRTRGTRCRAGTRPYMRTCEQHASQEETPNRRPPWRGVDPHKRLV